MSELVPGVRIDDITVLRTRVGAGGQGQVWRGWDERLARDVAVKILPADDPWGDDDATAQEVRATREARAVARLLHPGIAAVHRIGRWGRRPFIVSTWIDGRPMRAYLDDGQVPRAKAIAWVSRVGRALQHAHDRGVVHCDLKPENIVIADGAGDDDAAFLVDFGLARGPGLRHRSAVQVRGTQAYLPPEAGLEPPSAAGDQFALAVVACELWSGRRPLAGRAPRKVSGAVAQVLNKALSGDPAGRFSSVAHFVDALIAAARPPATSQGHPQDREVLAAFAATDHPETVERAFAAELRGGLARELLGAGLLTREGGLRPLAMQPCHAALAALAPSARRDLYRRLAEASERGDARLPWVVETVAGHWLGAGEPRRAAAAWERLADHQLGPWERVGSRLRAADLLHGSPADRHPCLVAAGLDAARCGWRVEAERALAAALACLVRLDWPADSATWALRGRVRALSGDAQGAADAWAEAAGLAQDDGARARAALGHARALLRCGSTEQAVVAAEAARRASIGSTSVAAGIVVGVALERLGRTEHAAEALRSAVSDALAMGDALATAEALIALAESLRRSGHTRPAAKRCEEANDALPDAVPLAAQGTLALVRGRVHLDLDDPWSAFGYANEAAARFAALALRPGEAAAWRLAVRAAEAGGGGAALPRQGLARLTARAGRPELADPGWWAGA